MVASDALSCTHECGPVSSLAVPPWHGPPSGAVPGVVPLERVLARNEGAAIFIACVAAYTTGFQVRVTAICRSEDVDFGSRFLGLGEDDGLSEDDEIPPEMLRFAIQLADGTRLITTGLREMLKAYSSDTPPAGPVLRPGDGGGGGGRYEQSYWMWPLPPPGPLMLECEWPAMGLQLTHFETDAQTILDAAARSEVIFPREQRLLSDSER
jgi:hypothetical protein